MRKAQQVIHSKSHISGYDLACALVEELSKRHFEETTTLEALAKQYGLSEKTIQRTFQEWASVTPKQFLQALKFQEAEKYLYHGNSVLTASLESGLSSPSRLHDLCLDIMAMPPGVYARKAEGLNLKIGVAPTPFGWGVFVGHSEQERLVSLGFANENEIDTLINEFKDRYARATFILDEVFALNWATKVFEGHPLSITLIGTDFEIRVWQALTDVSFGTVVSYKEIAERLNAPKAARAVGRAVGRNPIAFVIPCHRVIGGNGDLTGYHWGLTRKKVMLGFEKCKKS